MTEGAVTVLITSIASAVVTIATMVVGFLTLWVKLKYGANKAEEAATKAGAAVEVAEKSAKSVEKKIDDNTAITKRGSDAVGVAARNTEEIKAALNGGVHHTLESVVAPVVRTLAEHAAEDKLNMDAIAVRFQHLEAYMHQRNHEILNALGVVANKVELVSKMVKDMHDTNGKK